MSTIKLRFTLHRGFVSDGKYEVYVGAKKAKIEVKKERNTFALQKIFPKYSLLKPSGLCLSY